MLQRLFAFSTKVALLCQPCFAAAPCPVLVGWLADVPATAVAGFFAFAHVAQFAVSVTSRHHLSAAVCFNDMA